MKATDRAWAAGFIDGEGCVRIARRRAKARGYGNVVHMAEVSVAQVDPSPLIKLQGLYGGKIYRHQKSTDRHAESYKWRIQGVAVYDFLRSVRRYLTVKGEVSDVVLQLEELIRGPSDGRHALSEQEIAERDGLYEATRILNQRGIPRAMRSSQLRLIRSRKASA